jgi:preprotein translocase subunit YajC
MLLFISSAMAQQAGEVPENAAAIQFGFLILLFVVFYFVAIRPQRKRQKEHEKMMGELSKGDEVATIAGVLGKVNKLEDNYVVLQVADNVEMKFQKHAVSGILPKGTLKSI